MSLTPNPLSRIATTALVSQHGRAAAALGVLRELSRSNDPRADIAATNAQARRVRELDAEIARRRAVSVPA